MPVLYIGRTVLKVNEHIQEYYIWHADWCHMSQIWTLSRHASAQCVYH